MSFKYKVGDKVKIASVFEDAGIPSGTVLEITDVETDLSMPYIYSARRVVGAEDGEWLLLNEDEISPLDDAKFKSTGITVPFKARYLGTGVDVEVISVTDTSFGRIYWVRDPSGFTFSLPAAMFLTVE